MDIRACYEKIGGDYDEVISRFPSEASVIKFAKMFLNDPSYSSLILALKEQDYEVAFRAAHTLKGVCLNLGLGILYQSSHEITEALRANQYDEAAHLEAQVTRDYENTIQVINEM